MAILAIPADEAALTKQDLLGDHLLYGQAAGKKNPATLVAGFFVEESGVDLLSHAKSILSLAQNRFTALFEMGRGGSNSLWTPDITVRWVAVVHASHD